MARPANFDVKACIDRALRAQVAEYYNRLPSNRPARTCARTYALAIIVAGVAARYVQQQPQLHIWMMFVDGAIMLAVCVLVLEASMFVMLPGVQAHHKCRMANLSNMMTWLAVILGACGFMARLLQAQLFQRAANGTMTVMWLRMLGFGLVLEVLLRSIRLVVFGQSIHRFSCFWSLEMDPFYVLRSIHTQVAPLHLPARIYALAIIITVVTTQSLLPDEQLHPWVMFVEGALLFAVCALVLEASMLVMLPVVQAESKVEDFSNMLVWLAVISGACGYMARLFERSWEGGSELLMFVRMLCLCLVFNVLIGSFVLIVVGPKLKKRD